MPAHSHARVQQSFGFDRSGVPIGERLTVLARRLWPSKAAMHLAARAGVSHRTAELWFARQTNISGEALAELLRSDIGFDVLSALINGGGDEAKPSWWPAFERSVQLAELQRRADENARAIAALVEQSPG